VQGLPQGVMLSSVAKRFGEYCLELVLMLVTLFIGWAIWSLIIYGRGQTPAKQVLKMKIVKLDTGKPTSWGMTWVREWPCKFVIGFAAALSFYIVYFWPLWDNDNQELWDKMIGSVVVDDDRDLLNPAGQAALGAPAISQVGPEVPAPR
jgi:uncharacterized RDD family membrane protein YckC